MQHKLMFFNIFCWSSTVFQFPVAKKNNTFALTKEKQYFIDVHVPIERAQENGFLEDKLIDC